MRRGPLTLGVVVLASAGAVWLAVVSDGGAGPALAVALPLVALVQLVVLGRLLGDAPDAAVSTAAAPVGVPVAAPAEVGAPADRREPPGYDPGVLLEAQRRMLLDLDVARVAHQANNQLLGLRFKIASLERASDAERPAIVADLEKAGEQLERLVARLQELDQGGVEPPVPATLSEIVERAFGTARGRPDVRCCRVETVVEAGDRICERSACLTQALINLILNAAEAAGPEGHVRVSVEADGDRARLRVDDDGPGLDPEDHERLGRAFTTTRPNRPGLGLWAARRCVEGMGGSLELGVHVLGGLCVTLSVPVRAAATGPAVECVAG